MPGVSCITSELQLTNVLRKQEGSSPTSPFSSLLFSFLFFPLLSFPFFFPFLSLFFSLIGEQVHGTANEGKGLPGIHATRLCSTSAETLSGESPPLTSQAYEANVCIPLSRLHSASVLERPRHFSPAVHQACFTQPRELSSALPVAKK